MSDFERITPYPIIAPPRTKGPLVPSLLCALFVCAGVIIGLIARPAPPDVHIAVGSPVVEDGRLVDVVVALATNFAPTSDVSTATPTPQPIPTQDFRQVLPYCDDPRIPPSSPCVPLLFASPSAAPSSVALATPTLETCEAEDYRRNGTLIYEPCLKPEPTVPPARGGREQ